MRRQTTSDPREISGIIGRVDHLGNNTERLFSRLYKGLGRRFGRGSGDLQNNMDNQKRLLKETLKRRNREIARLNGILATIGEGVVLQNRQGRIVLINKAARELIGSQKAFWESELGGLFDAYREIETLDSELMPVGEPTRIQVNNRIIGAQVAAVADSRGRRLGTLVVLRDVTREALSDRLKDQFVTAISHELRTPMTVIKQVSEFIADQSEGEQPDPRFLEMLTRNVDVLDRMIVELLDISEMGAGSFSVRRDELDAEGMVWNVVNGLAPEIKRAQLDVAVMARRTADIYLSGDDQRLRWALGHLVENSIRYSEPGGHIIISIAPQDEDYLAVKVVDTGVGISEKDMPHIFERFYRGKPRSKSGKLLDPRGLGQGLFVAQGVAEAHEGYLRVSSQEGMGSIFTLVLPMDEFDDEIDDEEYDAIEGSA